MNKLFISILTIYLTACQTITNIDKTTQQPTANTLAELNIYNIIQDENIQYQTEGKNVLLKIEEGCQLDQIFVYTNDQSVTYRYIFKDNHLISSSTIMPTEKNQKEITIIWNDPDDVIIIENFKKAKSHFPDIQLIKCK